MGWYLKVAKSKPFLTLSNPFLAGGGSMKRMEVIDLFDVKYANMSDKINDVLEKVQEKGKIVDFEVLGSALNKCAVFVMYEEV